MLNNITPKTVNQALDKLFSTYSADEVATKPDLIVLKSDLKKLKSIRGRNYILPSPDEVNAILNQDQATA